MSKKTILVVDSDVPLLQVLAVRLRSEGYVVILAQDAHQGIQRAEENEPDLLLIEPSLPAGEGFSLIDRVRKTEALGSTPLVFLTSTAPGAMDAEFKRQGAAAVIHKPFDAATLTNTLREALGTAVRAPQTFT